MKLTALQILGAVKATASQLSPELRNQQLEICLDSRKLNDHCFFVCLRGERFDAHNFLDQAQEAGCPLVLIDQKWFEQNSRPEFDFVVVEDTTSSLGDLARFYAQSLEAKRIAITGSNGKTTTKEMLHAVLSTELNGIATKANNNNHIGVPLTLFDLEPSSQYAIVEIGTNHAGEIAYSADIACPHIAIINNIGDSHLEFFKNRDNVFVEKISIRNPIVNGGLLLINADDAYLSQVQSIENQKLLRFGIDQGDIRPDSVDWNADACAKFGIDGLDIQLRIPGKHNLYNALAVYAVAREMGITPMSIQQALNSFAGSAGRTEIIEFGEARIISDCYNANPTSMEFALKTLCEMNCQGQRIAVLGDMFELGDSANQAHEQIGLGFAHLQIDTLFTLGELARSIHAKAQLSAPSIKAQHFSDRQSLIDQLRSEISANDLVLFKASNGMKFQSLIHELINQPTPA